MYVAASFMYVRSCCYMHYALCQLVFFQSEWVVLCKWTPATTAVHNVQSISARAKYGIIVHIVMLRWGKCMHMDGSRRTQQPSHTHVGSWSGVWGRSQSHTLSVKG